MKVDVLILTALNKIISDASSAYKAEIAKVLQEAMNEDLEVTVNYVIGHFPNFDEVQHDVWREAATDEFLHRVYLKSRSASPVERWAQQERARRTQADRNSRFDPDGILDKNDVSWDLDYDDEISIEFYPRQAQAVLQWLIGYCNRRASE